MAAPEERSRDHMCPTIIRQKWGSKKETCWQLQPFLAPNMQILLPINYLNNILYCWCVRTTAGCGKRHIVSGTRQRRGRMKSFRQRYGGNYYACLDEVNGLGKEGMTEKESVRMMGWMKSTRGGKITRDGAKPKCEKARCLMENWNMFVKPIHAEGYFLIIYVFSCVRESLLPPIIAIVGVPVCHTYGGPNGPGWQAECDKWRWAEISNLSQLLTASYYRGNAHKGALWM